MRNNGGVRQQSPKPDEKPARSEHTDSGQKARPYPGGGYFQVHLGWKLHSSFPRRKVAPGEKTLYSLESKER